MGLLAICLVGLIVSDAVGQEIRLSVVFHADATGVAMPKGVTVADAAVGGDDAQVGVERPQRHDEPLVAHLFWLQHRNIVLERDDLGRAGAELATTPAWPI